MKTPGRRIKWLLVAFGTILLMGVSAGIALVAWEWTYIDRLRHFPEDLITNVAWYTPRERIRGGNGASLPRAKPDETGMTSDGLEKAARLAEAKNASALLVVHSGRVVLERRWRHRPGEPTNSASMAKTVTSLLVGIAVGEGTIPSLDEPAAKSIPASHNNARRKITLRHLLQMHSGLRPMGAYDEPFSDASYLSLGTDMRYVVDNIPAVTEPGTKLDYNNVNFQAWVCRSSRHWQALRRLPLRKALGTG